MLGIWVWYLLDVYLPWIVQCKAKGRVEEHPALSWSDGEDILIEALNDQRVLDFCDEQQIILAKSSASCSRSGNALDGGNLFKGEKTVVKYADQDEVFHASAAAQGEVFTKLRALLDPMHWPKGRIDVLTDKFLRVMYAMKVVLSYRGIMHSFKNSGQIPEKNQTFLDTKLALCTKKSNAQEYAIMKGKYNDGIAVFRRDGRIEEHLIDEWNIPKVTGSTDRRKTSKSDRPLTNQRSCILNAPSVIEFYKNYKTGNKPIPQTRQDKDKLQKKIKEVAKELEEKKKEQKRRKVGEMDPGSKQFVIDFLARLKG